jgi:hypothetical protein
MITFAPKWIGLHERSARGHSRHSPPIRPVGDVRFTPESDLDRAAAQNVAMGQERSDRLILLGVIAEQEHPRSFRQIPDEPPGSLISDW